MTLKQVPKVLLDSASMSAMLLYHHQCRAVLLPDDQREHPANMAAWLLDMGMGPILLPADGEYSVAAGPAM